MQITLILLGHVDKQVDIRKIKKWKSDIFIIISVQRMDHLPDGDVHDGYLDHKYSIEALSSHINCPSNSDLAIAIMPNRFEDNFYVHRLGNNCVAISLYGINDIISPQHISLNNFILNQIYKICVLYSLVDNFDSNNEVYSIVHRDTRGCLLDFNGDRQDIIFNTEKPIICDECASRIKSRQLENNYQKKLTKELKKIRKPILLIIEYFIKKYPLLSILLSALLAIILNLTSNLIFEIIK